VIAFSLEINVSGQSKENESTADEYEAPQRPASNAEHNGSKSGSRVFGRSNGSESKPSDERF
jgi:hypothetical protein